MRSLYDSYDICRQIRLDWEEEIRSDAGRKGKQCPGGYWIPANKQCAKGGKSGKMRSPGGKAGKALAAGVIGTAGLAGAGALAYKNRGKIVSGVDKAGSMLRKGATSAANKATEIVSKSPANSQKEEMGKRKMLQEIEGARQGVRRATKRASKTARAASAGAEQMVGKVKEKVSGGYEKAKGAVSGTIKKAKESYQSMGKGK